MRKIGSALLALLFLSFLTPAYAAGETTIAPVTRPYYPAYSPDGSKVYVPSESNNLTVIDTATNAVSTIAMGGSSFFVAFTPDGTSAYVSQANSVRKIDVAKQTLDSGSINVPLAQEIAISPDGKTAFVARGNVGEQGNLDVLDLNTNSVKASIPVGLGPIGAELNNAGTKVYVANFSSNNISIVDTTSQTVTKTIAMGANTGPRKIAFTPDGTKAYVSNQSGGSVRIIDVATEQLLPTIISGFSTPQDIAITADGLEAFVTNRGTDEVFAIDLVTNTRITSAIASTGLLPFGVALNPDPSAAYKAYVANYLGNSVTAFTKYKSRSLSFTSDAQYSAQYGSTLSLTAAPSLGVGDGTITFSAGQSTACSVNASTGVVTMTQSSGTCTISSSISNGDVYGSAIAPTNVTISPAAADLTLSATKSTIEQGEDYSPGFVVTAGSLAATDDISDVTYTFEGTGSTQYGPSETVPTELGTYKVSISDPVFATGTANNYSIVFSDGTLTIQAPVPSPHNDKTQPNHSSGSDLAQTGYSQLATLIVFSLLTLLSGTLLFLRNRWLRQTQR